MEVYFTKAHQRGLKWSLQWHDREDCCGGLLYNGTSEETEVEVYFTVHTSERTQVEVYFTVHTSERTQVEVCFTVHTSERTQVEVYFTVHTWRFTLQFARHSVACDSE